MARNRDEIVRVEFEGLEELRRMFETMPQRFEELLIEEMTRYAMLLEEGTKALAPKDKGDLEDSINFSRPQRDGQGVSFEGGSNLEYALRRHEEPYRNGKHPYYDNGAKFPDYYQNGRGARTRSKGSWRGEKAGRKYLERAVNLTEQDWNDMLERVLERCLREGLL